MIISLFWLLWPLMYATGAFGMSTAFSAAETWLIYILNIAAGCLLPLRGVLYLLLARRSGTQLHSGMLIQTVLESALSLVIIFLPRFSYQSFLVVLCLYLSFYTAVQGINAFIYGRDRIYQYFIPALCQALIFPLLIAAILLLPDDLRYRFVMSGSGYLLSILGFAYFCDWMSVAIKNKRAANIFHRISVTMPGFGGLGVPARLLHTLHNDPPSSPPDAEIIFNYGKHGKGVAGHCELCVAGKTFTYGNYDPASRAIFKTLGNGIIFRADKEQYIDFLLRQDRTVVVYGLRLSAEQKTGLQEALSRLEQSLADWQAEAQRTPSEEYIRKVTDQLDARVYRITNGRFRSYFLPTINCVTLTGSLLKGTAAGNVLIPGLYTPGAYMELLHRLYVAGNDVVFSVTTHHRRAHPTDQMICKDSEIK